MRNICSKIEQEYFLRCRAPKQSNKYYGALHLKPFFSIKCYEYCASLMLFPLILIQYPHD